MSIQAIGTTMLNSPQQKLQQQKLQKVLDTLPQEKVDETFDMLMSFSKNLLEALLDDDKCKSVASVMGVEDKLKMARENIRLKKDKPAVFIANFDLEYNKSGSKNPLLVKRYKNIIEEAVIPCELTSEFVEEVRNIGFKSTAHILEVSKNKFQAA